MTKTKACAVLLEVEGLSALTRAKILQDDTDGTTAYLLKARETLGALVAELFALGPTSMEWFLAAEPPVTPPETEPQPPKAEGAPIP